jgi:hypothetical protein
MSYIRTILIKGCISLFILSLIGCNIQEKKERKLNYVKPFLIIFGKLSINFIFQIP